MKKLIIILAAAAMTGCGIYKPYTRPEVKTDGLYGTAETADTTTIGNLGWEEMFTDPYLRTLIRQGLENNTDLQSAQWRVKEAEATLKSARLAYLPSFNFAPQGSMSSFDWATPGKTYSIPVTASWQIDIFNGLTNANRARVKIAKAQQEETKLAFQQALLNAGAEVNNALTQCQSARAKTDLRTQQIEALERAVESTELLMKHGSTTYLEVLTAQQSLLSAQLNQIADRFDEIQGIVNLYQALGGGRDIAAEAK